LALDRDKIFSALFERLKALPDFVTCEEVLKPWSAVPGEQQPALFVVKGMETVFNERGLPPKWSLTARLYLYAHAASRPDVVPGRQVNRLLTVIEQALERTPEEGTDGTTPWATTLGGLVSHAWIDGSVETDEGALGDQTVAVITVEMLATG
jgi:hypothetical protein